MRRAKWTGVSKMAGSADDGREAHLDRLGHVLVNSGRGLNLSDSLHVDVLSSLSRALDGLLLFLVEQRLSLLLSPLPQFLHRWVRLSQTDLRTVRSSASVDLSVVEEEERVVLSPRDLDDLCAVVEGRVESVDDGRDLDDALLTTSIGADSRLSERVETPGVHSTVLVDGERMEVSSADGDDVLEAKSLGSETVDPSTLDDPSSELALLAIAPHEDGSVDRQGEDVVRSAGDRRKLVLLEGGERNGGELALGRVG